MRISDWSSACALPISLFRSSRFRRQETELVIVVTPYLVKPVSASAIRLPTDGAKAPTDVERILLGKPFSGDSGATPPRPQTSRSEEHTSELQPLMRTSYAVLCLKTKKQTTQTQP